MSAPHTLDDWREPGYANAWNQQDALRDMLALPRRMAAALIGNELTPELIIDVGSGPGAFLEVFLDAFGEARGLWTDASEAMRDIATGTLARFGDRVSYQLAEMTDLSGAGAPGAADVVLSSRASHHLDQAGLHTFYAQLASRLRPGGWVANIDHVGPAASWDLRYRAVRPLFTGKKPAREGHSHSYPLPSLDQHAGALAAAGFSDVDVAWKAFGTVLVMGRASLRLSGT